MKLIAGLGNIGDKYTFTRHNAGFMLIDSFALNENLNFRENSRLKCLMTNLRTPQEDYLLIKPTTFMNLSGEAVRAVIDYYKIDISDVLIVYDDLSLEIGKIRFRPNGSDGGHNGIKNIIANLGTQNFPRIKVGVGEKPKKYDLADYVLSHFSKAERELMEEGYQKAVKAVEMLLDGEMEAAMNEYNRKVKPKEA